MRASLRAEWLKLTTIATFRWFLIGAVAVGAVAAFIGTASGPPPWHLSEPIHTGTIWILGATSVAVFAVILGSRTITEEFRHDTIVHTFVADPRRRRSTVAKAVVSALAAGAVATSAVAGIAAVTYAATALSGGQVAFYGSDAVAALGLVAGGAAWGVIGVGVGALVRQQIPSIVGGLLWLLVVENLAGGLLGPIGAFLPGQVAQAVAQIPRAAGGMPVLVAAGVLAAYAVAATIAGVAGMRGRDVL